MNVKVYLSNEYFISRRSEAFFLLNLHSNGGNILKSIFLFLFGLIVSWLILGVITGDYGIKNMLFVIIAYLGAKFAIRQRKK